MLMTIHSADPVTLILSAVQITQIIIEGIMIVGKYIIAWHKDKKNKRQVAIAVRESVAGLTLEASSPSTSSMCNSDSGKLIETIDLLFKSVEKKNKSSKKELDSIKRIISDLIRENLLKDKKIQESELETQALRLQIKEYEKYLEQDKKEFQNLLSEQNEIRKQLAENNKIIEDNNRTIQELKDKLAIKELENIKLEGTVLDQQKQINRKQETIELLCLILQDYKQIIPKEAQTILDARINKCLEMSPEKKTSDNSYLYETSSDLETDVSDNYDLFEQIEKVKDKSNKIKGLGNHFPL